MFPDLSVNIHIYTHMHIQIPTGARQVTKEWSVTEVKHRDVGN